MSFTVVNEIANCQNELNVINQRITETDWILFFNRANKYFMTSYKMPTTQRVQDFLIFNGVREYPLPTDFVGHINLERPYDLTQNNFYHTTESNFIRWMQDNWSAIKFDKENQLLMINYTDGTTISVNEMDSLTANGTWSASGDASSLAVDGQYYTSGDYSLRFTATYSTGTATLTNSTMNAIDFTDYIANGFAFIDVYNSSTTPITSMTLRFGSDASNYYQVSATTRYNGQTIGKGFGQVGFDLSGKTTVGSPTVTAINYVLINFTLPSGFTATIRVDNLIVALPTYFTMPYYSLYNIKSNAGTYQESITSTSDTVLCPAEFNEAYTYKVCALGALLKLQDANEANYFEAQAAEKEANLRSLYPNQQARVQTTYYKNWKTF